MALAEQVVLKGCQGGGPCRRTGDALATAQLPVASDISPGVEMIWAMAVPVPGRRRRAGGLIPGGVEEIES